jgi:hypothetical protein
MQGRLLERQLDAELLDHVERQTADYVRSGMEPVEARRQALIAIGGLEQVKEQCREARGTMVIAPTDPGTFAGVATVLVTIGLLASYVPARRAMRVDPTTALQSE